MPLYYDIGEHSQLRLLCLDLGYSKRKASDGEQKVAIQWFRFICQSVRSQLLRVQLYDLPADPGACKDIEDSLLSLNGTVQSLSVYLDAMLMNREKLFSRMYESGIIIGDCDEESFW